MMLFVAVLVTVIVAGALIGALGLFLENYGMLMIGAGLTVAALLTVIGWGLITLWMMVLSGA